MSLQKRIDEDLKDAMRAKDVARLSVLRLLKAALKNATIEKGGVLVGFHERGSSYVAEMRECHVMPRKLSDLLMPLRTLIESLTLMTSPEIGTVIESR